MCRRVYPGRQLQIIICIQATIIVCHDFFHKLNELLAMYLTLGSLQLILTSLLGYSFTTAEFLV